MNAYPNFLNFMKMALAEVATAKGVRIKSVVLLYRLASYCVNSHRFALILLFPIYVFYRIYTEFLLGLELPPRLMAGPGLKIYHGQSLIVHGATKIGARCTLRQGVTIGNKTTREGRVTGSPVIGDDVEIGAGAMIIGEIKIGNRVSIGACTVVTKDVPDDTIVVGQAPRVMSKLQKMS
jgi:putative colanic acid biosynthesis acetyltransferase WcaB